MEKTVNAHSDAYTVLAAKHGFGTSQSYLRVLRFLMTPEQADLVTLLPGSPEEVAKKSGTDLAAVKRNLEILYRKGIAVPRDYKNPDYYIFCKYASGYGKSASLYWAWTYTLGRRRRGFSPSGKTGRKPITPI
jgi:hypothetical protein